MINKFNNPDVRMDVLILSIAFSVTGLNLQLVCSHGVALCFSYSPSDMRQAMARIHRNGQLAQVYWFLIKQVGGYSEVQERTIHAKQAKFHSAQANIPWEIRGSLRELVCFDLAREDWGSLESKYVWVREAPQLRFMKDWRGFWLRRYVISMENTRPQSRL